MIKASIMETITDIPKNKQKENLLRKVLLHFLQQPNSGFFTGFDGSPVPNAGLDFADMGTAHHQHTQPGLPDTAADSQG